MNWLIDFGACLVVLSAVFASSYKIEPNLNKFYDDYNIKNIYPKTRIVNGDVAPKGRFTYQVALINSIGAFCSGALISNSHIITAAQCIDNIEYMIAYLGVHNIRESDENWIQLVLHRDSCLLHPDWNPEIRANDIAIIEFPEPVQLTSYVSPIALPSRQDQFVDYSGEWVTVAGWGYDDDDALGLTPLLHFAQLQIVPDQVCRHFYRDIIKDTQICTDTQTGKAVCQGDSGTPISYRKKDGTTILVGMASLVSKLGCASGWPNIFTRLDKYLDWIKSVTNLPIVD